MKNQTARRSQFFTPNQSGLTLTELLVVIAVLGIISVAGITRLNIESQFQKANDAKRKANLSRIQIALDLYKADIGSYPTTASGLTTLTQSTPKYLESVPTNQPKTGDAYTYTAVPAGCDNTATFCYGYSLVACLENTGDTEKDTPPGNTTLCPSPKSSITKVNP